MGGVESSTGVDAPKSSSALASDAVLCVSSVTVRVSARAGFGSSSSFVRDGLANKFSALLEPDVVENPPE